MQSHPLEMSNDDTLIIESYPDPLRGLDKEVFVKRLREALAGKVIEAYVFGSFTTDKFSSKSDIDLVLVTKTSTTFVERFRDFPEVFRVSPRTDLLIYTPEEFARFKEEPRFGFWKTFFEQAWRII